MFYANVAKLTINELLGSLSNQVLERDMAIRLVQWWMKFMVKEPGYNHRSTALKDATRFFDRDNPSKVDSFQSLPLLRFQLQQSERHAHARDSVTT